MTNHSLWSDIYQRRIKEIWSEVNAGRDGRQPQLRGLCKARVAWTGWLGYLPPVANIHDKPAALKALQDAIYRDRIRLSRMRTVEQRLGEVFELSNHMFGMMHGGAMDKLGTRDPVAGWEEVRRWMMRLDRAREHGLYVTEKPAEA